MSYSVVIFNNDNEVATVSSKWFKDSGCVLWPNCRVGKKLQNMLLNHEEPGADWVSYDVRVLSSNILTLKSAREKERLAEENSDLSSAEDGSRIIYAPSRFNSQEYCQPPSKISKITSSSHTTSYLKNPLIPHKPSLVSHPSFNQTSALFSKDDHSKFTTQEFLRPLAKIRKYKGILLQTKLLLIVQSKNIDLRTNKLKPNELLKKFTDNEIEIKILRRSIRDYYKLKKYKLNTKDLIQYNKKRRIKIKRTEEIKQNEEQIKDSSFHLSNDDIDELCMIKERLQNDLNKINEQQEAENKQDINFSNEMICFNNLEEII